MAWVIRCLFIQIELWWASGWDQGKASAQDTCIHFDGRETSYCIRCILLLLLPFCPLIVLFLLYHRDPRSCFIIQASLSLRIWCGFLTTEMTGMYHEAASVSPLLTNIPQPAWFPSVGRADAQTLWWICVFFYFLNSNKLSSTPLAYVTFVPEKYHNLFSYINTL